MLMFVFLFQTSKMVGVLSQRLVQYNTSTIEQGGHRAARASFLQRNNTVK